MRRRHAPAERPRPLRRGRGARQAIAATLALVAGGAAFVTRSGDVSRLMSIPADGSVVEPQRLASSDFTAVPLAWSSDGRSLLLEEPQAARFSVLHLADQSVTPWLRTPFVQHSGRLSPDGHWIAYSSDQSGTEDVWIRPFTGSGAPTRVSADGGRRPFWSSDAKTLFFEHGASLVAAAVTVVGNDVQVATPHVLFQGGFRVDDADPNIRYVDATPDGRFLVVEPHDAGAVPGLVIAKHWDAELSRLLPPR